MVLQYPNFPETEFSLESCFPGRSLLGQQRLPRINGEKELLKQVSSALRIQCRKSSRCRRPSNMEPNIILVRVLLYLLSSIIQTLHVCFTALIPSSSTISLPHYSWYIKIKVSTFKFPISKFLNCYVSYCILPSVTLLQQPQNTMISQAALGHLICLTTIEVMTI